MRFLAFSIFFLSSLAYADEFCNGFEHGFETGYMQASGRSFAPPTPLCPRQPLSRINDPKSDFEQGYLIGLRYGLEKGNRSSR